MIEALGAHPSASIPAACGGWAETKAAYRLFDHERVDAQRILEPHYRGSEQRLRQHPLVLCIQDTSELNYTGKNDIIEGLGPLNYDASACRYGAANGAATLRSDQAILLI